MKVLRERQREPDKVELPMTPMIDVVFQLLVFFILTFRIASVEGDFNIKMPLESPNAGLPDEDQLLPMRVRLRAAADGQIAQISLDDNNFGVNFDSLRNHIIGIIGDERGPGSVQDTAEVELECDFNLRYEHVIQTITAVSGYVDGHGEMVKLVERVKLCRREWVVEKKMPAFCQQNRSLSRIGARDQTLVREANHDFHAATTTY